MSHTDDAEPCLVRVSQADFEQLAALRDLAMRPSLERLGRYDPERSRSRLRAGFVPEHMRWICTGDQRVGLYALRREEQAWRLAHFYLHPEAQGRGLGSRVLRRLIAQTRGSGLPVLVTALRGSAANAFYLRHGFVQVDEAEWDIDYARPPEPA